MLHSPSMSSNPREVFDLKVFRNLSYQQNCYLFGWDRLPSVEMCEQNRQRSKGERAGGGPQQNRLGVSMGLRGDAVS